MGTFTTHIDNIVPPRAPGSTDTARIQSPPVRGRQTFSEVTEVADMHALHGLKGSAADLVAYVSGHQTFVSHAAYTDHIEGKDWKELVSRIDARMNAGMTMGEISVMMTNELRART